jgi:hypothetical protein
MDPGASPPDGLPGLPPPAAPDPAVTATRGPLAFAGATLLLHAACGGRLGIFRDELYFLECGRRLSAGYVDQPPGVAVVARLASALFGTWVPGLRLLPWLAVSGTVYLTGRLAARLGGGAAGATVASAAAFACLLLHGTGHLLTMNAFDPLLVTALALVLVRLADGEAPRLWVAAGGLAGLAVLFKYTSAPIALALLGGVAATSARRTLWTRWAAAGAAVGLAAVLPNLVWQAGHGFPFLELVRNGVRYKNVPITPPQFLGGLVLEANPLVAPVWLAGLAGLLAGRRARFAGLGALAYLLLLAFGQGKVYYATPVLPLLLAGGGAALAPALATPARLRAAATALALAGLVLAPMAIPLLPAESLVRYQAAIGVRPRAMERTRASALPQVFADQLGWPELAAGVARVYRALPPEEQARAAVYGSNYGVASAVNVLGPALGLPTGIGVSGHNQYWLWGLPPGRGDPLLVVSGADEDCGGLFRERALAARLPPVPFARPEDDAHWIWICRGARRPLTSLPEEVRHLQ